MGRRMADPGGVPGLTTSRVMSQSRPRSVVPAATQLTNHKIPFIFYTGYVDTGEIREKFPHCKIVQAGFT
jgi:hypothetical protein